MVNLTLKCVLGNCVHVHIFFSFKSTFGISIVETNKVLFVFLLIFFI